MKENKRQSKEENIISAAEKVFEKVGFKNAKMEEVAKLAGITKVTLYSYFQSKENLYMALTYKGYQKLLDSYYKVISENRDNTGLVSSLQLLNKFMDFSTEYNLYNEALLSYFSTIRTGDEEKLPDSVKESIYFQKMQNVHNIIFKLAAKEIVRGKEDGSIESELDPMFLSLHAWSMIVGYSKLLSASGNEDAQIFHFKFHELKNAVLHTAKMVLVNKISLQDDIFKN